MPSTTQTRQVIALSPGLPADVLDELLTATESALLRHGATGIRLDMSQPGLVVLAEMPVGDLAVAGTQLPGQWEPVA
jgi:hypothetical protein